MLKIHGSLFMSEQTAVQQSAEQQQLYTSSHPHTRVANNNSHTHWRKNSFGEMLFMWWTMSVRSFHYLQLSCGGGGALDLLWRVSLGYQPAQYCMAHKVCNEWCVLLHLGSKLKPPPCSGMAGTCSGSTPSHWNSHFFTIRVSFQFYGNLDWGLGLGYWHEWWVISYYNV